MKQYSPNSHFATNFMTPMRKIYTRYVFSITPTNLTTFCSKSTVVALNFVSYLHPLVLPIQQRLLQDLTEGVPEIGC